MKNSIFKTLAVAALLVSAVSAAPIQVGTRLSLVIDVSGSVDSTEYNLQMDGYGAAFRNASNQALIINGNGIAVNYVFFASTATAASPWTLLNDVATINAFATLLETISRPSGLGTLTDIAAGMRSSLDSFANTTYTANRNIMDVSGDGISNDGVSPTGPRDAAANQGIVVNGVTIGGGATLSTYYTNNVITNDGFVEAAVGFDDFSSAINRKIFRELGGEIPEPSTYAMMATGLLGLVYARRRK